MKFTGSILGYDPGGKNAHGVALFSFKEGKLMTQKIETVNTSEEVLTFIENEPALDLTAIGIDTLTCWFTGKSGWRPADLFLRSHYKSIIHSITSPNSLFGSMGINGMAVLIALKSSHPDLVISETHPKVLYYALSNQKYNYSNNAAAMDKLLSELFNAKITTQNDHEWDAVLSIYAALKGITQEWTQDLHNPEIDSKTDPEITGRYIKPCGDSSYWWPNIT